MKIKRIERVNDITYKLTSTKNLEQSVKVCKVFVTVSHWIFFEKTFLASPTEICTTNIDNGTIRFAHFVDELGAKFDDDVNEQLTNWCRTNLNT